LPVWNNLPAYCFFPDVSHLLARDAGIQKTAYLLILYYVPVVPEVTMHPPFERSFGFAARQEEKLSATIK